MQPGAKKEAVVHPDHYNKWPVECIDICEWYGFNVGNAIKYLWRAGFKEKEVEDVNKALWYLRREWSNMRRGQTTIPEVLPIPSSLVNRAVNQFSGVNSSEYPPIVFTRDHNEYRYADELRMLFDVGFSKDVHALASAIRYLEAKLEKREP